MAEDSQLGQPSQEPRENAAASYQRGRRSSNARTGFSGSEEIIQSDEDRGGDGRNPEESDENYGEMGDGGGAVDEEDGDEEYAPGDGRRGKKRTGGRTARHNPLDLLGAGNPARRRGRAGTTATSSGRRGRSLVGSLSTVNEARTDGPNQQLHGSSLI